ncbi:transmembrane protein 168-like [Haliotis cracherodii]|uniref:transmembrane protein 168-like n=1 Tax=Haliotis cracherodii TaxID=6455 RepID=UPI0039EA919D
MFRGVRAVRYYLVHLSHQVMQSIKDFKLQFTIQYVGYIPDIILLVALGLGLYIQWHLTNNTVIAVISLFGLFVFGISCALRYYFSMQSIGNALFHIWTGCLVGIIAFSEKNDYDDVLHEVMEMLFLTSMVSVWFWNIFGRIMHFVKLDACILTQSEGLESLGLIIATFVMDTSKGLPMSMLIVAFTVHLIALRMKSFLGLISFLSLLCVGIFVFFPGFQMSPNKYALICFIGRHAFQPIIDFYFSALTTIERWKPFFNLSKLLRYLVILFVFGLDLVLASLIGIQSFNHKEWFVVVPVFAAFAFIWILFHLIYFISCWKLMGKITECNLTYISLADEQQSYNRIMASKGIRHFGLISHRLICLSLTTTIILTGIGWETRTGYSLSLAWILLPIEAMSLSLFYELGDFLGGTCTGFGLIAPVTNIRPNGPAKLLSSASLQDMTSRATNTLNHIHKLFGFHMIDNYGCDYSTSGLSEDYLKSKVNAFFERRTADGPRFDTYMLYYSGEVYENGELALADNKNLKPETLLEWWATKNDGSGSRLIIVLDAGHYTSWTRNIRNCVGEFVAIQTCKYSRPADPESGGSGGVGSFTEDWVNYNVGKDIKPSWTDKTRPTEAIYVLSKYWSDFTFHLPTSEDFAQYWDTNFPKITKPLIKAVNLPSLGAICCMCTSILRCLRRKQMKWLPPKEIDTGHGFKLVRT